MRLELWKRVSNVFELALDVAPDQREVWLKSACGDESEIEAAVSRLLRADDLAAEKEFLEASNPGGNCDWFDSELSQHDDDSEGSRLFGPYRLLHLIGEGGMGEVHLAERTDDHFEQRVALKLLPHPTPGLMRRFKQERQILAGLSHPNIARLLDGGIGHANIPYFAMEYVEGVPINRYVVENNLDVRAILSLFLDVCDAIQFAHRNLVVHRDIKPTNVLVGADRKPKVLDFGIAKILLTTADSDLTVTFERAMTPDYAAPEQMLGEAVTTATDVYSLGIVLYELLTGQRPYKLGRDVSLQQAVNNLDPSAPSSVAAKSPEKQMSRRRARTLRGDLDRIVMTAIAKEPERRYPTVEALAADIKRYVDGRPVRARGNSAWYRLRKFALRNRIIASALAGITVVLIAATTISVWQAARADRERATALHTRDFLLGMLSNVGPYRRSVSPAPTLSRLLEISAPKIQQEFAQQPETQIPLLRSFAGAFLSLGRASDSAKYLEYALDRERSSGASPELIAETLLALANDYYYMRRFDESNQLTDDVVASLDKIPLSADRQRLEFSAREIKLLVAWSRGHVELADRLGTTLLENMRAALDANDVEIASAENYVSFLLLDRHELIRAGTLIEHMSNLNLGHFDTGYPGNYGDALVIAWWLEEVGDAISAEPLADKVLELRERVYSGVGFAPAYARFTRGWMRCSLGRYEEGLADIANAQATLSKPGNVGYMYQSRILLHQGKCLLDAGKFMDATRIYTQARDVAIADGGTTTPNGRAAEAALLYLRMIRGEKSATTLLRDVLVLQKQAHDPQAEMTSRWLSNDANDALPSSGKDDSESAAMRLRLLELADKLTVPET